MSSPSFECHSLPEYRCWHQWGCGLTLLPQSTHLLMAVPSKLLNHFKLVCWTRQWVHCIQMASTVNSSQSKRAPFRSYGVAKLHGCAAICSICASGSVWWVEVTRFTFISSIWYDCPHTVCWLLFSLRDLFRYDLKSSKLFLLGILLPCTTSSYYIFLWL